MTLKELWNLKSRDHIETRPRYTVEGRTSRGPAMLGMVVAAPQWHSPHAIIDWDPPSNLYGRISLVRLWRECSIVHIDEHRYGPPEDVPNHYAAELAQELGRYVRQNENQQERK